MLHCFADTAASSCRAFEGVKGAAAAEGVAARIRVSSAVLQLLLALVAVCLLLFTAGVSSSVSLGAAVDVLVALRCCLQSNTCLRVEAPTEVSSAAACCCEWQEVGAAAHAATAACAA